MVNEFLFEEKMEDGSTKCGTIRFLDNSLPNEIDILRKLANAVDDFQRHSKYVSGDFGKVYRMLVAYRAFKAGELYEVKDE